MVSGECEESSFNRARDTMNLKTASSDIKTDKNDNGELDEERKNDIKRMVQYTRWILEFLGIWPLVSKKPTRNEKLLAKFFTIICLIGLTFNLIPTLLHMIMREKNSINRLILLGPIGSCVASFVKYDIIILRSKTLRSCIKHMEMDWIRAKSDDDRAIMTRNVTVGRGLTLIYSIFMYTGGMSYHTIMPILKGTSINQFNKTIRPLVYPGFNIFVDPQVSPNYEIIFFTSCVSAFVRYTVNVAGFNLAAVFVTHACGQIQIVTSRLAKLFDEIDDNSSTDELQDRISTVIQCHVSGLRLSSRIEKGLRDICLIEVMASTMGICLLGYYLLTFRGWKNSEKVALVTFFILLISYVFDIFILCHIGELLKEQYHAVGEAAYMMEWYRLPGKHGLALVMVMAMASYPRKITAGRIMDLSVRNFGAIVKTSVTYLNMLRATTM